MKLRNKKTGEIVIFGEGVVDLSKIGCKNVGEMLEAGWEDYEEVITEIWVSDSVGNVREISKNKYIDDSYYTQFKEMGNYFNTKEEAEKAVEKLKAWKRLKDKGFMFCGTDCIKKNNVVYFEFGERPLTQSEADEAEKDLHLLFGGEE